MLKLVGHPLVNLLFITFLLAVFLTVLSSITKGEAFRDIGNNDSIRLVQRSLRTKTAPVLTVLRYSAIRNVSAIRKFVVRIANRIISHPIVTSEPWLRTQHYTPFLWQPYHPSKLLLVSHSRKFNAHSILHELDCPICMSSPLQACHQRRG